MCVLSFPELETKIGHMRQGKLTFYDIRIGPSERERVDLAK